MGLNNCPISLFFLSPLPVFLLILINKKRGGLLPTKCMTGDVVLKSYPPWQTPNEETLTPIKPSPASLATCLQPITCQNPHGNALEGQQLLLTGQLVLSIKCLPSSCYLLSFLPWDQRYWSVLYQGVPKQENCTK